MVGISYFWSANPSASYVYFSQVVQLFVLIWLLYEFSNTEKSYFSLLFAYVLGCFISSGNTIYNYLTSVDIYANRWVADGFNANYLAYTLTLALPIAWYLYKSGYRPKLSLLYVPIGIYATILTSSRTAFIGLIIFFVFLCWQFVKMKFRYKKRIIFLFLLLSPYLYSKIPIQSINRLMTITSEVTTGDLNNRSYIWNYAIETLREVNVFFGGGAGSFPMSAHNVYLGLIVELGVIGLLFYVGIILINAVMVKKMNNDDKWLWTLMLIMWFVYSNMATIENEKMTWFIFGMIPVCYYIRNRDFKRKTSIA